MPALTPHPSRRSLLLAGATLVSLAGCGGGSSDESRSDGPRIQAFSTDRDSVLIGEGVQLSASFQGGSGRIEPGIGVVSSGVPVVSAALDRDTQFTLVVEAPGQAPVRRSLAVTARYRDRYHHAFTGFLGSLHAAVATSTGNVLLIGGSRGESVLSSAVDRFNPESSRFSRLGSLAIGRAEHRATLLADGRVMVSGGTHTMGDGRLVELIDERSGAVAATGPLSVPRVHHAAIALPDGRVLVSGGAAAGEWPHQPFSDSAELWEPSTQRFRRLNQRMHMSRGGHTMSLLADGRVLIVGGFTSSGTHCFAEVFDPATERFTPVAAQQPLRAHHAAHVDAQGRVLVLGGETGSEDSEGVAMASVLRFEPGSGSFALLPALAGPRTLAGTAMLPSGQVLLFGGQHAIGQASASAERYDPAQGGVAIAALDSGRAWHSVTRLLSGRVLVAGGENSDGEHVPTALIYE